MASYLQQHELIPDRIFCSTAERTRETLAYLEDTWNASPAADILPSLYLPSLTAMLGAIATAGEADRAVLLLAHNPGCEQLVQWLTGYPVTMTTANVAHIALRAGTPWTDITRYPGVHSLQHLMRPKMLGKGDGL